MARVLLACVGEPSEMFDQVCWFRGECHPTSNLCFQATPPTLHQAVSWSALRRPPPASTTPWWRASPPPPCSPPPPAPPQPVRHCSTAPSAGTSAPSGGDIQTFCCCFDDARQRRNRLPCSQRLESNVPLIKASKCPTDLASYRSISLLYDPQVLERLILSKSVPTSSFRAHYSTTTLLTTLTQTVL